MAERAVGFVLRSGIEAINPFVADCKSRARKIFGNVFLLAAANHDALLRKNFLFESRVFDFDFYRGCDFFQYFFFRSCQNRKRLAFVQYFFRAENFASRAESFYRIFSWEIFRCHEKISFGQIFRLDAFQRAAFFGTSDNLRENHSVHFEVAVKILHVLRVDFRGIFFRRFSFGRFACLDFFVRHDFPLPKK